MPRVLFIGPYGIGNLLMAMPAIRAVVVAPGWSVDIGCLLPSTETICREISPFRDWFGRVYPLHDRRGWRGLWTAIRAARRRRYDYSVVLFPSARIHYNLMGRAVGARIRVGSSYPDQPLAQAAWLNHRRVPVKGELHDIEQMNRMVAEGLGVEPVDHDYVFRNPDKDRKLVAVHPGCKKEDLHKRWPLENYVAVIGELGRRYPELRFEVYFGPDEADDLRRFQRLMTEDEQLDGARVSVRTGLGLAELFDQLGRCQYFVGNDSGLMHIAAAQGVIVAGVIGPSDERRTGPRGPGSTVICDDIDCRPCTHTNLAREFGFRCVHPEQYCLTRIRPEQLVEWFERHRVPE